MRFSVLVLFFLSMQFSADYMLEKSSLDRLARIAKVELIAKYDQLPENIQRFIELNQQKYNCCGVYDFNDYNKLTLADLPG